MSAVKKINNPATDLVTKSTSGLNLTNLIVEHNYKHVCQEDGFQFFEETKIAEKLSNPKTVNWISPIENLFLGQSLELKTLEVTKESKKHDLIQEVENFFLINKVKQTLLQDICLAVEETMSNVLMHAAPHIQSNKIGQIQLAIDPANFKAGFVCQDFAGKMNIDKMLKKIHTCYADGVGNSISMTTRGAGIGTFLVFDGASSYFIFNKQDQSAFVGASYPIMSDKKRLAFFKHFHIGNE